MPDEAGNNPWLVMPYSFRIGHNTFLRYVRGRGEEFSTQRAITRAAINPFYTSFHDFSMEVPLNISRTKTSDNSLNFV